MHLKGNTQKVFPNSLGQVLTAIRAAEDIALVGEQRGLPERFRAASNLVFYGLGGAVAVLLVFADRKSVV